VTRKQTDSTTSNQQPTTSSEGTTMAIKQARWKCPQCDEGVLAPTRPRKDDVRRYCLPCSSAKGRLVERIAPALEAKREQRIASTREKVRQKRQVARRREQPKKLQERCDAIRERIIRKEAERIWKLMSDWHKGKPLPNITIARGQNRGRQYGHANIPHNSWNIGHIQVNVDADQSPTRSKRVWAVLAHELAHIACPPINKGGTNYDTHNRVFYYCLRHAWQKRWKCDISFAQVRTWGYSVDYIIQGQAYPKVNFILPNPVTPPKQNQINNNTEGK
jgi:hypothetical protein